MVLQPAYAFPLSVVFVHHFEQDDHATSGSLYVSEPTQWTLYIGVTSDLIKRVWQHKTEQLDGFTKKYGIHFLVYYELHQEMLTAIAREKQLKKWKRAWKLALIEKKNPQWRDLWQDITA